ncbi:MAG TPA: peptidoglycan editing factor PgeF [Candidatus Sulfotelmatobacter sp.]|nr:peptidoglycan editing factor PgeF [Candidatus Sulfotelmatobacter sp.]
MATLAASRTHEPPKPALRLLHAQVLKRIPWLVHGFSTRPGGSSSAYGGRTLNLGFTKDDARERVERNRRLFLGATGASNGSKPWPLITIRQVHSDLIRIVRSSKPGLLVGDGMVTSVPGIALGILTADCFPVLLVDAKNKAVGAFHCGWRPTAARMVEKGLGIMRYEFGTRPEDVYAAIGPGIQSCCYEVGEELKEQFESQFAYASELFHSVQESDPVREKYPMLFMNMRAPGHGDPCIKLHLDLREANRRQLLALGVPEKNISALKNCTACDTRNFFSHRAEKGRTGRMLAIVGIKSLNQK